MNQMMRTLGVFGWVTLSLLLAAQSADAIEAHGTAYSRSLGLDPLLLDDPALALAIPSLLSPTPLVGSYYGALIGGLPVGASSLGLLAESRTGSVGLAWAKGKAYRFGVSVLAGRSERYEEVSSESNSSEVLLRNGEVEASLGVSRATESFSWDLALSARVPTAEYRSTRATVGVENRSELETIVQPGVVGRFRVPVGDRFQLRGMGSWHSRESKERVSGHVQDEVYGQTFESYGDIWSLAAAVATFLDGANELYASVDFDQTRRPDVTGSEGEYTTVLTTLSHFGGKLAADISLFGSGIRGLVGTAWGVSWSRYEYSRPEWRSTTSSFRSSDSFTWGLAYQWRGLALVGHMDRNLELGDLFYGMDVELSL